MAACCRENLFRDAARGPRRAETAAGLTELAADPGAMLLAAIKRQHLARDGLRRHLLLQELRLERLAEQNIGQAEALDVHEQLANRIRQRRQPVEHDARQSHERRLHDDRARRRDGRIHETHERIARLMRQHDMHARIVNQRAQQPLVHAIGDREIKLRLRPLDEELLRRL